jgi:hypothetical protein
MTRVTDAIYLTEARFHLEISKRSMECHDNTSSEWKTAPEGVTIVETSKITSKALANTSTAPELLPTCGKTFHHQHTVSSAHLKSMA